MPGNRKVQGNGSGYSDSSNSDKIEEGMRQLKMESGGDDNGGVVDDPGVYPDRPGEPDCIYYLRTGTCGYGSNCRFNHPSNAEGQVNVVKNTNGLPERAGQPDCGYYLKTGTCKYGATCKYHHPKDRQNESVVVLNILGLPMRQDEKPCAYYMRTGLCKYGYACKFHHPQPTSPANVLPAGPVYGTGGSVVIPSTGAPSVGEVSGASLSKPTYYSGPLVPIPQSYMPIIVSSSQGWNAYGGGVSPLSVTGVLTAPTSNGSVSYLPERPDQPECRYFMNHGSCKYGSDCKYHHPREKLAQLASNPVGPVGLPVRPGQPPCSYYRLYGLCKYGPTCKFDHSLNGYSYAYSLTIPPLASSYSPIPPLASSYSPPIPYPTISPLIASSQTSSSSQSLRSNDWVKKDATSDSNNKNLNSNTKSPEDSPDASDSVPRCPEEQPKACTESTHNDTSEITHNESG